MSVEPALLERSDIVEGVVYIGAVPVRFAVDEPALVGLAAVGANASSTVCAGEARYVIGAKFAAE